MAKPHVVPAGVYLDGERRLEPPCGRLGQAFFGDIAEKLKTSISHRPDLHGGALGIQGPQPRSRTHDLLAREVSLEDQRPVRGPGDAEVEPCRAEGLELPPEGVLELGQRSSRT